MISWFTMATLLMAPIAGVAEPRPTMARTVPAAGYRSSSEPNAEPAAPSFTTWKLSILTRWPAIGVKIVVSVLALGALVLLAVFATPVI